MTTAMTREAEAIEPEKLSELHEKLAAHIEKEGLRSTSQRKLVADVFFRSQAHLSIEELYDRVREIDAKVGHATVYRTLKLLKECGLANERNFGDGMARYEVAHEDEHHDHMICLDCDYILEFESEELEALQDKIAEKYHFKIQRHSHDLYCHCTKKNCDRRPKS